MQTAWELLKATIATWLTEDCQRHAAALSFYLVLSLSPLLILLFAIVGAILGQDTIQTYLLEQITLIAGPEVASTMSNLLASIGPSSASVTASLFGLGILVYTASIFLAQVHRTLNILWKVPSAFSRYGALTIIRQHMFAIVMMVGIIVFFFFSFVVGGIITLVTRQVLDLVPELSLLSERLDTSLFVLLALVFAVICLMFKYVSDAHVRWRDVFVGALFTVILFGIGEEILEIYLRQVSVSSLYGAAGSLIVFLLWIYYTTQIFLLGAVFTYVFAERRGFPIRPRTSGTDAHK